MNEADWLSSKKPRVIQKAIEPRAITGEFDRKLRLFACECVRRIWHMLGDAQDRNAFEVAERYADG